MGLADRIAQESHEVEFFSAGSEDLSSGKGLFNRPLDFRPHIRTSDLIICDSPGWTVSKAVRNRTGLRIFGFSSLADLMMQDPVKTIELFEKVGIEYPPSQITKEVTDLTSSVIEWEGGVKVVKFKDRVIRCTHQEFLAWAIPRIPPGENAVIQQYIPGDTVKVCGFFNGRDWVKPTFLSIESDDLVSIVAQDKMKTMSDKTLFKLTPFLRKIDFRGFFSVRGKLDRHGNFYAIDLFPGLLYPTIYGIVESMQSGSLFDLFYEVANGDLKELDITFDVMCALNVHTTDKFLGGSPVVGYNEENKKHLFLHGVRLDGDYLNLSGKNFLIYTATAHGRSFDEAKNRVLRTVNNVDIAEPSYASTTLESLGFSFNKLNKWRLI